MQGRRNKMDATKEGFEKEYEKGRELAQAGEIEELLLEVYRKLYLIPDELREPLKKLVELLFEQTKEFFPDELTELLAGEEKREQFKGTLAIGVLQFLVGAKEQAIRTRVTEGYGS